MIHIKKIIAQTPLRTVQKNDGSELKLSTLVVQEPGNEWANTYAVQLFGAAAEETYQPGDWVMVALRFRTHQNGEQVYQDVTADEIVKMNSNNPLKIQSDEERLSAPF